MLPAESRRACVKQVSTVGQAKLYRSDETPAVLNNAVLRRIPHARLELHNPSCRNNGPDSGDHAVLKIFQRRKSRKVQMGTPAARVKPTAAQCKV